MELVLLSIGLIFLAIGMGALTTDTDDKFAAMGVALIGVVLCCFAAFRLGESTAVKQYKATLEKQNITITTNTGA